MIIFVTDKADFLCGRERNWLKSAIAGEDPSHKITVLEARLRQTETALAQGHFG